MHALIPSAPTCTAHPLWLGCTHAGLHVLTLDQRPSHTIAHSIASGGFAHFLRQTQHVIPNQHEHHAHAYQHQCPHLDHPWPVEPLEHAGQTAVLRLPDARPEQGSDGASTTAAQSPLSTVSACHTVTVVQSGSTWQQSANSIRPIPWWLSSHTPMPRREECLRLAAKDSVTHTCM